MASDLRTNFTINGVSNYKGRLCLRISKRGSDKRAYIPVKNITQEDLKHWDEKAQGFKRKSVSYYKNDELTNLENAINVPLSMDSLSFASPQDIKKAYEAGRHINASVNPTFLEVVEKYLAYQKDRPSANYERYVTLSNKLKGIGCCDVPCCDGRPIYSTPFLQITNEHFKSFGLWAVRHGYGYKNLMYSFRRVFNWGVDEQELKTTNTLTYQIMQHKPTCINKRVIHAFSLRDFDKIRNFDLSQIDPKQQANKANYRLYKDFAIFMYLTLMRPADVVRLKWHNVDLDKAEIHYHIFKLRNKDREFEVNAGLCNEAVKILRKYEGVNKNGYVFPLAINDTDWDSLADWNWLMSPCRNDDDKKTKKYQDYIKVYRDWYEKRTHNLENINNMLHKMQDVLQLKNTQGCKIDSLHLYIFRHSAITHAIRDYNLPPSQVADLAGTSTEKIYKHYLAKGSEKIKSPLGA